MPRITVVGTFTNGWVYSGFGNLMHRSEKFLLTAPLAQTSYCAGNSVDVAQFDTHGAAPAGGTAGRAGHQ
jgi:hypothetical protein